MICKSYVYRCAGPSVCAVSSGYSRGQTQVHPRVNDASAGFFVLLSSISLWWSLVCVWCHLTIADWTEMLARMALRYKGDHTWRVRLIFLHLAGWVSAYQRYRKPLVRVCFFSFPVDTVRCNPISCSFQHCRSSHNKLSFSLLRFKNFWIINWGEGRRKEVIETTYDICFIPQPMESA